VAQQHPDARLDASVGALEGQDRLGVYADGMQELDWVVGELVGKLDELGIADNTVVVFATTTARRSSPGRMVAPHHFAARRASVGRAASERH
jgi:hypothetical protein